MKDAVIEHVRVGARSAKFGWKSVCVSAAMIVAVGCGGDDGGNTADGNTTDSTDTPTKDAGKDASSTADAGKDASNSTGNDASSGSTGDAVNGKKIASTKICTSCHGDDYSGAAFYPNITPDKDTGIGDWTDDEIKNAFNNGKDQDGSMLCSTMMPYKLNASDSNDLLAFLRSLKAVNNEITQQCD